jgi:hypothetical protein
VIVDRRSEMIRRPTVLILGAGASAEYDFPVGRSLLLQIVNELRQPSRLEMDMRSCGFSAELIKQFCRELNDSNQPSVDAFLEQHKDNTDYERLGKAAIAASLIRCEDKPVLTDRRQLKLYEYIWHRASTAPGKYGGNALSILTFNYDRSFEEFLRRSLAASHPEFREKGTAFQEAVSSFPVVHLYGSLGSLHEAHDLLQYGGGPEHPALPPTILSAAGRIRLYHQAKFDGRSWEQIQTLIGEAETICFLGFGFYPMNIKLLQGCGLGKNDKTRFYASAFGLTPAEQGAAREAVKIEIQFASEVSKCLEALRRLPVLVGT